MRAVQANLIQLGVFIMLSQSCRWLNMELSRACQKTLWELLIHCTFARPERASMKEGIHPDNYRTVIFKDLTADWRFLGKSCAESKETEKWDDGNEYPVIKVEVSSASHPFFTGKNTLVDTAGRIDKFRTRYAKHKK